MAEKNTEPKLKPLPSFKVSARTPKNVKNVLREIEETFKRTKILASLHRSAIEEARKGEKHFQEADRKEEIAKEFSNSTRNLLKKHSTLV